MRAVQVQMETCDIDSTLFIQYKPAHVAEDGRAFLDITVVERDRQWFADNVGKLRETWEEVMRLKREAPAEVPHHELPSLCHIVDGLYDVDDDACEE